MTISKNTNVPVLAITNQKGGVGKTTTAEAIVRGVAADGGRVLALDLDPQGSLSALLSDYVLDGSPDTTDFIKGRELSLTGPVDAGTIVCVPAYEELARIADEVTDYWALAEAIDAAVTAGAFDLVVIDTHPDKDLCVILALFASTHVLMPASADALSIEGVRQTLNLLADAAEERGSDWEGRLGVVITMYRTMTRLHRTVEAQMRETLPDEYGVHVFKQHVTNSIQVPESQALHKSLYEMDRVLHGAASDYRWLTDEVMGWLKRTSGIGLA